MAPLPRNAVLLAFEGPDPYSMVGGLGTRVTELSAALADAGVRTTLVFVGDPGRPPVQQVTPTLEYRRWCQGVSGDYPAGVYAGELGKVNDYTASVPRFVAETIVAPAAGRDESVLIVAEEWQTAACAIELDAVLSQRDLKSRTILGWNANNTYGFDTIDWTALARAARITTVSRYMKFELQAYGIEARVIPNGIPERLLAGAPEELVRSAGALLRRRPLFVKVGRFEEDKRWMQAIEAFADLRARHPEAMLVVRGGREGYGDAVFERARALGLEVEDVTIAGRDPGTALEAIARASGPIVNVRTFLPEEALLALYRVADAVLANSGREPFGLVGLEVMAVGGIAVTGSTGEDYAQPFENAIVCDTSDPRELAAALDELVADPALGEAVRTGAQTTAKRYAWPRILEVISRKLDVTG
ncbi:MAG TPA: glycosyltransferase [Candidatus Dormibacteraeota bacterium]|nr:glycosyltransferase [Candidatus Dormibacteraeota bacterium]